MGTTTHDIFGATPGAQPATPGSYGERPSGYRLPEATRLGRVRLQIADLHRSLAFYQDTLGLRVLRRDGSRAVLAAQGDENVARPHRARVRRDAGRFALGNRERAVAQ